MARTKQTYRGSKKYTLVPGSGGKSAKYVPSVKGPHASKTVQAQAQSRGKGPGIYDKVVVDGGGDVSSPGMSLFLL